MSGEDKELDSADCFAKDLDRLIDYYRSEFDLTLGEAVGALELIKFDLMADSREDDEDDDFNDAANIGT